MAAELARGGRSVVVLEMGGYRNEADFKQLELPGMFELYLGRRPGRLGGRLDRRSGRLHPGRWNGRQLHELHPHAGAHPQGVGGAWASRTSTSRPMRSTSTRSGSASGVNDTATSQNRTHKRMIAGCDELGYSHRALTRNADVSCEDPGACGYCYAGCQNGCKQSTMKTYLQDAADAGARFVVGARAERILTSDGHATGVEATSPTPTARGRTLEVSAETVVVAAGAIESPALLLRSGIGGPAARTSPAPAPRRAGRRVLRVADRGLDRPDPIGPLRPVRRLRGRLGLPDRGHDRRAVDRRHGAALGGRREPQADPQASAPHRAVRLGRPRPWRGAVW